MGAIAGQIGQAAANTAFLAKGEEIFAAAKEGPWSLFTDQVPCDGQSLEIDALGSSPVIRQLVGSRRFGSLRALAQRIRVSEYSTDAIELSRIQVDKDKSGIVAKKLSDYLSQSANFWDKAVSDAFIAMPKGIDGVALISTAHPNGFGGNWSNDAAAALSPDAFNTGIVAMTGLRLENGEPAGFSPTHLMVGPKNRKMAVDLCGEVRPFPMNASGVEAYTSALAPTAIPNWMAGQLQVIVNPRLVGTTTEDMWFLMDLSRPGVRPMILGEAIAPRAVVVDDPQSEPVAQRAAYQYFCDGAAAIGGYAPHCLYGHDG